MNALFNVSDRYAVVLLTYISQLTTVYLGIEQDAYVQSWSRAEFVLIVEHAIRAWGIIMGHHHGAFIQIHEASSSGA